MAPVADRRKLLKLNVEAPTLLASAVAGGMVERGSGDISKVPD